MTNLCRDEVTTVLKDRIESVFGGSFNTNGLGAVLTCGVTGIKAGLSHSPLSIVRLCGRGWRCVSALRSVAFPLNTHICSKHTSTLSVARLPPQPNTTPFPPTQQHPQEDGRERYVFFSFPHTAINDAGEQGVISRPNRPGDSCACGALAKALGELQIEGLSPNCRVPGVHDPLDPEYSILKQRLARRIRCV